MEIEVKRLWIGGDCKVLTVDKHGKELAEEYSEADAAAAASAADAVAGSAEQLEYQI